LTTPPARVEAAAASVAVSPGSGAVWELSTLAAEWRRIYQRQVPGLAGALDFHDRWLPGVARSLAVIQADCVTGRCMATESRQHPVNVLCHGIRVTGRLLTWVAQIEGKAGV
jgi:hypothetical protein